MTTKMASTINHQVEYKKDTKKGYNLPIFPLQLFLLPDGITRLRIFEPRYLKMISIASKGEGFIICQSEINSLEISDHHWGSWVEVINFNQGDDGVLEVDVKCKSLVKLLSVRKDEDMLHHGNVIDFSHWSVTKAEQGIDVLSNALIKVFESNKILNDIYLEKFMDNPTWVVARWLEILPMSKSSKTQFVELFSFEQAQQFVQDVIYQE